MPYSSKSQAAKFHILEKRGKISPATVKEFDQASKGMKLPERVKKSAYAEAATKMKGGKA